MRPSRRRQRYRLRSRPVMTLYAIRLIGVNDTAGGGEEPRRKLNRKRWPFRSCRGLDKSSKRVTLCVVVVNSGTRSEETFPKTHIRSRRCLEDYDGRVRRVRPRPGSDVLTCFCFARQSDGWPLCFASVNVGSIKRCIFNTRPRLESSWRLTCYYTPSYEQKQIETNVERLDVSVFYKSI